MMTRKLPGISVATVFSDFTAIIISLVVAYYIRFHLGIIPVTKGYSPGDYLRLLPFVTLLWLLTMNLVGLHRAGEVIFDIEVVKKIIKSSLIVVTIVVSANFFLREASYSRLLFVITPVIAIFILSLSRLILSYIIAQFVWKKGRGVMRLFIVGTGQMAETVCKRLAQRPLRFNIVGLLATDSEQTGKHVQGLPVLGEYHQAPSLAKKHNVDCIIVAEPNLSNAQLMKLLVECSKQLVDVRIVPGIMEIMLREASVVEVEGIPLLGLRETPLQGWNMLFKRLFDIFISLPLIIILSPVFLFIAILIKLDSSGPVFYTQERMGLDGRVFKMIKFRSMFVDAEKHTGPVFATPNDPRCTRVGRLLRRVSLDELPQLFNVLLGEMSLVGPRPERPHFVKQFREMLPDYMLRHKVKAGLTGWAQVNGLRGNTPIQERIKHDLYYIENWSLWLDIKIILLTLFTRKNAY
ncbi:undecaprenyl-phosphate glucose phosphotransferase [Candidatus Sumerlaeota bacterium]|nr:undecaprenyl-phosphate glucose phosphotransferase [Candidatus Sumerlaeota bacterium]